MKSSQLRLLAGLALLGAGIPSTFASTASFVAPSFRGQPNAEFAGWEVFTTPVGPNAPDIAGSNAAATFAQNTVGAFVTGSGNIYAGPPPTTGSYTVSYSGSSPVSTVVFQVRTVGLQLDYGSISLDYGSGTLSATRTELENVPAGGGPGSASVASSWTWDLSAQNASAFTINFVAASPDVSLDSAHLDVAVVPEPTTWALFGAGAAALALARWRRR